MNSYGNYICLALHHNKTIVVFKFTPFENLAVKALENVMKYKLIHDESNSASTDFTELLCSSHYSIFT